MRSKERSVSKACKCSHGWCDRGNVAEQSIYGEKEREKAGKGGHGESLNPC